MDRSSGTNWPSGPFFSEKKMGSTRSVFWNIDFHFCENPYSKLTKMGGAGRVIFGGQNWHDHRKKLSELPGSSCSAPPGKVALLGTSIGVSPPPPPPRGHLEAEFGWLWHPDSEASREGCVCIFWFKATSKADLPPKLYNRHAIRTVSPSPL